MVHLGDLLLHKAEAAHDVPPDCGFQRGMYSGLVVDHTDALLRQIPGCPADGGVIVRGSGNHLFKGIVRTIPVGVLEWQRFSVWVHHAKGLCQVREVILGQLHSGGHDLL